MKTYTRQQLVKAMQIYNQEVLAGPEGYDDIDASLDCAERQVDKLLELTED